MNKKTIPTVIIGSGVTGYLQLRYYIILESSVGQCRVCDLCYSGISLDWHVRAVGNLLRIKH